MHRPWLVLILIFIIKLPLASAADLSLGPVLTQELNLVLGAGDALRRGLASEDDERIELSLRDLLTQTTHAKSSLGLAKLHERGHLVRILESAYTHFEMSDTATGPERRRHLMDGFNQLANLARIYNLDRAFAIYFCAKDGATWIQKGGPIADPFLVDGSREKCGIKVSK